MTLHYEESGHDPTRGVVCECGAKFTGGTSGTYHYHRYVNIYGGGGLTMRQFIEIQIQILALF